MREKAVILLSGGVDSSTVAYWAAMHKGWNTHALTINYGHKALVELQSARKIASLVCESHKELDLNSLKNILKSPLTDLEILQDLNDQKGESYYIVPLRNIIFLSIASAYAESIGAQHVAIGNHLDDAQGFPDCRPAAMNAMQRVVAVASEEGKAPKLWSPWIELTKVQIIKQGTQLGVPYQYTYSCYADGIACGVCESCEYRYNAFLDAGIEDPIPYKVTPRRIKRSVQNGT
jgi:7-cyano-7-deazaguanine synthase